MAIHAVRLTFVAVIAACLNVSGVSAGETPIYTSRLYPGVDGRLIYIPDDLGGTIPDFSHAGYMGGGVAIPYVPTMETLWPVKGDNTPHIQDAIDRIAKRPPDDGGFRGAVLLKHGYYELHSPLKISSGGVVLRGEGQGETGTVLIGKSIFLEGKTTLRDIATLITVGGETCWNVDETSVPRIADDYVPVGSTSFRVDGAHAFKPGDTVLVRRYGNQAWINELGMNLDNKDWRWEPFTIRFDRVITRIDGDRITIDAPLVCAVDKRWGGGDLVKYSDSGRISQVGIENLRGVSEFDQTVRTTQHGNIDRQPYHGEEYYSDENHYWNFIRFDNAKNIWVRNVTAKHFAGSLVTLDSGAKWATIQDCESLMPVSVRAGGRRFVYHLKGQLALVQRCVSDEGRHSFVLQDYTACGPNVFLDCGVTRAYSSSEPHYRFVTGALYDNVMSPLTARFWKNISIGWSGANCVFWNCEGPYLIQNPPTARNYAFGHIGIHAMIFNTAYQDLSKEDGVIESWDRHVDPKSLYLKQLEDRLGPDALRNIGR